MGVQISEDILSNARMTPHELLIEIAVHLYDIDKLTLGQARRMAGLDQISFQKEMAIRNVLIKFDVEDLMVDLETIASTEEE